MLTFRHPCVQRNFSLDQNHAISPSWRCQSGWIKCLVFGITMEYGRISQPTNGTKSAAWRGSRIGAYFGIVGGRYTKTLANKRCVSAHDSPRLVDAHSGNVFSRRVALQPPPPSLPRPCRPIIVVACADPALTGGGRGSEKSILRRHAPCTQERPKVQRQGLNPTSYGKH